MDLDLLFKFKPQLKPLEFILRQQHIVELLHADVSLTRCLTSLLSWTLEGEVVYFVAFTMFGGFAIALTVMDMVVLTGAAFQLRIDDSTARIRADRAVALARKLKELSMLDVAVMGVVVVVVVLVEMRKKGLVISMDWGLLALLLAELCHYVTFYVVTGAAAASSASELAQDSQSVKQDGNVEGTSACSLGEPCAVDVATV